MVQRNKEILSKEFSDEPFSHSKILTLMIERCMKKAGLTFSQLSAVAVSSGPGSYTGLRIASSVAKGIVFALDCKFIAINTLDIIYEEHKKRTDVKYFVPTIDARRDEAYISIYTQESSLLKNTPFIFGEDDWTDLIPIHSKVLVLGNAANKASDIISAEEIKFLHSHPDAQYMLELSLNAYKAGDFEDMMYYTPNYVKAPNITKSKKKLVI